MNCHRPGLSSDKTPTTPHFVTHICPFARRAAGLSDLTLEMLSRFGRDSFNHQWSITRDRIDFCNPGASGLMKYFASSPASLWNFVRKSLQNIVAQCSAKPASVAATPPCSATPLQRELDVRHPRQLQGDRCDRAS